MSSSQPLENRRRSQVLSRIRAAVPSRVVGHALVITLSIGVAYAGHANHFSSQLDVSTFGARSMQPSAYASNESVLSQDTLTPAVAAPAANPNRSQVLRYVTAQGDTVSSLADRFNVSENTIIWSNSLTPGQALRPGQVLFIPPVSGLIYTVQTGDTVDGIAQRFESDTNSILTFNTVADPSHLMAGSTLVVPGGRQEDQARAALSDRSGMRSLDPSAADSAQANLAPPAAQPTLVARVVDIPKFIPFAQRFMSREVPASTDSQSTSQPLQPIVYKVAQGDTLSGIATKFGISPENLAASNGLQGNADSLAIDQKLLVPPVPGVLHLVVDGDTLEGVSQQYSANQQDVAKANGLSDPYVLQVGKILIVPGGQAPAQDAPATMSQSKVSYTVQEGDSVSSIGDTYGVDPQSIIDANNLPDPYVLQPGQQIVIPGASDAHPASSSSSSASAAPAQQPAAQPAARPAPQAAAPAPKPAPKPAVVARPAPVVHTASKPAPAPSSGGWGIVSIASRYLGVPYAWGGVSPGGFDCSGLVWYVYHRAGISIPRDLYGQLQSGSRVSRGNLLPGDIVFFANTYEAGLSHDGIYIGGGRFINAVDYGIGVAVSSLNDGYWSAHYYGASRPW